jgi:hypothetical protein
MKISQLPVMLLPLVALAIGTALAVLFTAMFEEATSRGIYLVWQENETFAAATVALLAAMVAARPVYLQVRAQSVQASLDLLRRIEADTEACIDTRKKLFDLRSSSVMLTGAIHGYALAKEPSPQQLREAVAAFLAVSPRDLMKLAERPTINSADQMKLAALSAILKIAQQVVVDLLAEEWGGVIAQDLVAQEHDFVGIKLAGVFNLSSEIAEHIEDQEDAMRERAKQLRVTADTVMI